MSNISTSVPATATTAPVPVPIKKRTQFQVWRARLNAVIHYVTMHGEFPRQTMSSNRSLAVWLSAQRSAHRRGLLSPERVALLDRHLPGWSGNLSGESVWRSRLSEVVAFTAEHGRLPNRNSGDPVEVRLGNWVNQQRRTLSNVNFSEHHQRLLDEQLPGWSRTTWSDEHWLSMLDRVTYFVECNGRYPATNYGSDEYELSRWLRNQRYRKHALTAARREHLDRALPNWENATLPAITGTRDNE